jgi:hypothetical protein
MKPIKVYVLTVLFSTGIGIESSAAATLALPLSQQVQQVTDWFTGLFNNDQQVENLPMTPPITMANCSVELLGGNFPEGGETLYLEQTTGGFPFRTRFYTFSASQSQVNLSVRSFLEPAPLLGLCDRPSSERVVSFSNIIDQPCDVKLDWQPGVYVGTNDPEGCLTNSGGKVISDIAITANTINSLDQIFDSNGTLLFATPIEFRRVEAVEEPSSILELLAFGFLGMGIHFRKRFKHQLNAN